MSFLPKTKSSRPTPVEAPRSQLMTSDLIKKRNRRFKLVMGGIVTLSAVQLLFYGTWVASSAFKVSQVAKVAPTTAAPANDYQAIATAIAKGWLNDNAANDLPLSNGVDATIGRNASGLISYTGLYFNNANFESIPYPAGKTTAGQTIYGSLPLVVDHFIVTTSSTSYDLAISLAVNNGVASLYGLPYLSAATIPSSNNPVSISSKYPGFSVTQSTASAVNSWATAFMKNDSQTLYLLSGDPNQDHYLGLTGWAENGNPTINYSYMLNSNEAVVNITIPAAVEYSSTTTTTGTGVAPVAVAAPVTASLSYDLLLSNVTKAVPSIAAWGPTGSGPMLKPYQNAQSGALG